MTMSLNGSTERLANGVRVRTAIPAITERSARGPRVVPCSWRATCSSGSRHTRPCRQVQVAAQVPRGDRLVDLDVVQPVRSRLVAGTVDTAGVCALVTTF